jgi:hypothetical protein
MARHKIERRKALDVCRLNQLRVGNVVHSDAWVSPRIIRDIHSAGVVVLAELREDGTMRADLMMSSLPVDVRHYEHPARHPSSNERT